jgi:hypothetical protein
LVVRRYPHARAITHKQAHGPVSVLARDQIHLRGIRDSVGGALPQQPVRTYCPPTRARLGAWGESEGERGRERESGEMGERWGRDGGEGWVN